MSLYDFVYVNTFCSEAINGVTDHRPVLVFSSLFCFNMERLRTGCEIQCLYVNPDINRFYKPNYI